MDMSVLPSEHDTAIYVADLTAYNNGELRGGWIILEPYVTEDEIWAEIEVRKLIGKNPDSDGEWNDFAIHDMQGIHIGEYTSLSTVVEMMDERGELERKGIEPEIYEQWCKETGNHGVTEFEDAFRGMYSSFNEYAEQFADDCVLCEYLDDSTVVRYFDYDAFARDLAMDYHVMKVCSDTIAVFDV